MVSKRRTRKEQENLEEKMTTSLEIVDDEETAFPSSENNEETQETEELDQVVEEQQADAEKDEPRDIAHDAEFMESIQEEKLTPEQLTKKISELWQAVDIQTEQRDKIKTFIDLHNNRDIVALLDVSKDEIHESTNDEELKELKDGVKQFEVVLNFQAIVRSYYNTLTRIEKEIDDKTRQINRYQLAKRQLNLFDEVRLVDDFKGANLDNVKVRNPQEIEADINDEVITEGEAFDTKRHLCNVCKLSWADCTAVADDITYGDAEGNDNICNCERFIEDKPESDEKSHCNEEPKVEKMPYDAMSAKDLRALCLERGLGNVIDMRTKKEVLIKLLTEDDLGEAMGE